MVGGEVGPRVHRKRSKPWTLKGVGDLGKKCPQWKEIGKGCKDRAMRDPAEEGRDITNKRPCPCLDPSFPVSTGGGGRCRGSRGLVSVGDGHLLGESHDFCVRAQWRHLGWRVCAGEAQRVSPPYREQRGARRGLPRGPPPAESPAARPGWHLHVRGREHPGRGPQGLRGGCARYVCALRPPSVSHPLASPCHSPGLTTAPATVAPQIRSSGATQEHSVLEGQEVRLDCEADGQPPPDVTWLKDGGPLDQGVGPHLR